MVGAFTALGAFAAVGNVGAATVENPSSFSGLDTGAVDNRPQRGPLAETVYYEAADSLTVDFGSGQAHLMGKVKIRFGTMELQSGQAYQNWKTRKLRALPLTDSLGHAVDTPTFADGDQRFVADSMEYDLVAGRGKISRASPSRCPTPRVLLAGVNTFIDLLFIALAATAAASTLLLLADFWGSTRR
jgi:hypothetical protein